MKFFRTFIALTILTVFSVTFGSKYYNHSLCSKPGFSCMKVKARDTWEKLFPDETDREIVKKINRMNIRLYPGMIIAYPNSLDGRDLMSFSPFPSKIDPFGDQVVVIDLSDQAFGAYDSYGTLVHWGPISGGQGWCSDVGRGCRTPTGRFYIYSKGGPGCISSKYPIPEGGAPMPYCMFFYGGYALHASFLPGYHASHGCVRMFYEDAEWLNKEFSNHGRRTKVVVQH